MLEFRPILISDKPRADALLQSSGPCAATGCFAPLFVWQDFYGTRVCFDRGPMFLKTDADSDRPTYLFPRSADVSREQIELLREDAHAHGARLVFSGLCANDKAALAALYPDSFDFCEQRDNFEYVYSADKLIALSGKKLHAKRNFVNRFCRLYDGRWKYISMDERDRRAILDFWHKWHAQNIEKNDSGLEAELGAITCALDNFRALDLRAGGLILDGALVGFSLGCAANRDTFDVQIEKAIGDSDGAYAVINREFAAANCGGFKYINREEDLGHEGLRKAKLSYHPELLIEKFGAVEK